MAPSPAVVVVACGKKGPNMAMPEDVEMAKAFVATSEDNIVGQNMKSAEFKGKMLVNYNELVKKYNRVHSQQHQLALQEPLENVS